MFVGGVRLGVWGVVLVVSCVVLFLLCVCVCDLCLLLQDGPKRTRALPLKRTRQRWQTFDTGLGSTLHVLPLCVFTYT